MFRTNNNYFKLLFIVVSTMVIWPSFSIAQNAASVEGSVINEKSQQPIPGANIIIIETEYGTTTDSSGRFRIDNIIPGIYAINASCIGFETQTKNDIKLTKGQTATVRFNLNEKILELESLQIEADLYAEKYKEPVSRINLHQIKAKQINTIPGAFDDVIRSIHIFGNVMPASDYTSFFSVRGGSPDQNLVVMDGIVIPNPYRFRIAMGGGMSIFDPNITKDVSLKVGGFSSEYGNFLSSVLEVDTRDGNNEKLNFKTSLNLLDFGSAAEGPLFRSNGSFLVSVRRTYLDLMANQFVKTTSTFPYSSDFNGKLVYNIAKNNKLSLHFMSTIEGTKLSSDISDEINLEENSRINIVNLSWKSYSNDRLRRNMTLAFYKERFNYHIVNPNNIDRDKKFTSKIRTIAFSEKADFSIGEKMLISRGVYFSNSKPDITFINPENPLLFVRTNLPPEFKYSHQNNYFSYFTDATLKVTNYFQTKFGVHYDYSSIISDSEFSPRISFWLRLNNKTILEGSWGNCYQYPNVLNIFNRDKPFDFNSDIQNLQSEKVSHYSLTLKRRFGEIFTKLDLYYKDYDRLIFPQDYNLYFPTNNGKGLSKGIEMSFESIPFDGSKLDWTVNYSYGIAKYKSSINRKWQPFNFDRRHAFSVFCNYKIFQNIELNLLWRIASGLPYSPVYGLIHSEEYEDNVFLIDHQNRKYFSEYQRLDIRINYQFRWFNKLTSFYFEVINAYNHKNIYDQIWDVDTIDATDQDSKKVYVRTIYMLPILPTIGFSIDF